ncbi:MAG: hypothetical protein OYM47_17745 [Gemmatimonadota bacterium]|nr:hypothetical protein [Gemmatimonadota bacterium]
MNTGLARLSRSKRVPVTEIRLARKYREDFLPRFDESSLKEELDEGL